MGAWGTGPFDNDDAGDWLLELETCDGTSALVSATLEAVGDEVDSIDASRAVAAVAWLLSERTGEPAPTAERPLALTASLCASASRAVDFVLGDGSEWRELWEAAGEQAPIRQVEAYRALLLGGPHEGDDARARLDRNDSRLEPTALEAEPQFSIDSGAAPEPSAGIFSLEFVSAAGPWTHEQIAQIRSTRSLAIVLSQGARDLRAVTAVTGLAGSIEALSILGQRDSDLAGLEAFFNLKTLVIAGKPPIPRALTFPRLEQYFGPIEPPLWVAPSLKVVDTYESGYPYETLSLEGPIEVLDVKGAKALRKLPRLRRPEALRSLRITDAKELDLRGVRHCVGLQDLLLGDIERVTGFDELERLPALRDIWIEFVAEVDEPESLLKLLSVERGRIYRSGAFSEELRSVARRRLESKYHDTWLL